jgi:hypothetical protein
MIPSSPHKVSMEDEIPFSVLPRTRHLPNQGMLRPGGLLAAVSVTLLCCVRHGKGPSRLQASVSSDTCGKRGGAARGEGEVREFPGLANCKWKWRLERISRAWASLLAPDFPLDYLRRGPTIQLNPGLLQSGRHPR